MLLTLSCHQIGKIDWKNRLDRTLKDISSYYKDEFESSGFKSDGIPFEMDNLGYRYHLVQGLKPSNDYTMNSGGEIEKEIFEKLTAVINPGVNKLPKEINYE